MLKEDKTFSGFLFLDLRMWWCHRSTLYMISLKIGKQIMCNNEGKYPYSPTQGIEFLGRGMQGSVRPNILLK